MVSEPNDSMEAKVDNILAQLAALMEEVRSTKAKVDEHDKLLEKLAVEPRRALATMQGEHRKHRPGAELSRQILV